MSEQVVLPSGMGIEIEKFSGDEEKLFYRDIRRIFESYSNYVAPSDGTPLSYTLEEDIEALKLIAQMSKKDIIGAGVFNGAFASTGFGVQQIRPDHILPAAQGRTFYVSLASLTPDSWYGLWHNGAIGAAYDPSPLYLRKWLEVGITGFLDVSPTPLVEEIQFEINGKPEPIMNIQYQELASGARLFHLPKAIVLKPYLQYRSQFKVNAASGDFKLLPLGASFVKAEFMRITQPEQPDDNSP